VVYALDRGKLPNLTAILQRGDLLLLSSAVAGGCLYDLFNKPVANARKYLLASMLVVIVATASMWFTDLAEVNGGSGIEPASRVFAGASHGGGVAVSTIVFLGLTATIGLKAELLPSGEEG